LKAEDAVLKYGAEIAQEIAKDFASGERVPTFDAVMRVLRRDAIRQSLKAGLEIKWVAAQFRVSEETVRKVKKMGESTEL
jgi:DNA-binding NarL/FixJ family response regulator